jgi:hypothetical protein
MNTALLVAELVGDAEHRPPKNRLAAWNENQRTVRPEFSVLMNVNVRESSPGLCRSDSVIGWLKTVRAGISRRRSLFPAVPAAVSANGSTGGPRPESCTTRRDN